MTRGPGLDPLAVFPGQGFFYGLVNVPGKGRPDPPTLFLIYKRASELFSAHSFMVLIGQTGVGPTGPF